MNALSTVTTMLNLRSKPPSSRFQVAGKAAGLKAILQTQSTPRKSENPSSGPPVLQLGDTVRHGRFGTGQVMARLPDGRLQIRFDGVEKSLMIFPSLLQR